MRRGLLTFPDGASGCALLLVRLAVACMLATAPLSVTLLPSWVRAGVDMVGLALLLGIFTRLAASLAALALLGEGLFAGGAAGLALALHGLDAAALALLGAGAYSIDACLFGRRVISLDG